MRHWTRVVGLLKDWREIEEIFVRAKCFPVARKAIGNCCCIEQEVKEVWMLEHHASYCTLLKSILLSDPGNPGVLTLAWQARPNWIIICLTSSDQNAMGVVNLVWS